MSREKRSKIAKETLEIIEKGYYEVNNKKVDLKDAVENAVKNSRLIKPDEINIDKKAFDRVSDDLYKAKYEITEESTLSAAKRIIDEGIDVICLNFASAKNPGGGFLSGSQAQEESIARATALYPCIYQMEEMYDFNKKIKTCLYSDYMIYSPDVPVFRDDFDNLLESIHTISIITAPAVNKGALKKESEKLIVDRIMINRIKKILYIAAFNKKVNIILGAYGCGVFKNDALDVATYFKKILVEEGYDKFFKRIVFAIYEKSGKEKIDAFKKVF